MHLHYSFGLRMATSMRTHGCSWELIWVVVWDVDHMLFANDMFCREVWNLMLNEAGTTDAEAEKRLRKAPFSGKVVDRAAGM